MNTSTTYVGIKEFRQNIAQYAQRALRSKKRFIVQSRGVDLFEVRPVVKEDSSVDIVGLIARARKDFVEGKFYTQDDMVKMLA